jgi:putative MATE family efflux protein
MPLLASMSMSDNNPKDAGVNPLAAGSVGRLLVGYAAPSIVAMLVGASYNMVDQVFIGRGVGMLGNAATNVAFPLVAACMSVALMLGIGGASCFNLNLGRGNREYAGRIAANAITFALIFGVSICAAVRLSLAPLLRAFGATDAIFSYAATYTGITSLGIPFMILSVSGSHLIRADGSPKYSMACNLVGALLNTILDPLFIFCLDMGIAGAAWATVISQAAACAMAVRYLARCRSVRLMRAYFRPRRREFLDIASLGMSSSFNQLAMMFVQITLNNTLARYGAESVYGPEIPLAASGIITKVNMLFLSVVIGLAQGGQPIIGFNYGAGNYARVKAAFRLTLSSATCVSVIAFMIFQIYPRGIISLFGTGSEAYYQFVERYFRVFLFMTFVNGIQPVTANFFSSIGKAARGLLVSLTRQIIFLLPLIIIFPRYWGIDGIMYAGPVADLAAVSLASAFIIIEVRDVNRLEREQRTGAGKGLSA